MIHNHYLKSYSSSLLCFAGIILVFTGLYFIFLRPELLPEDLNYIGSTKGNIQLHLPGLSKWLQKVFWVLGGYIFTTGFLIAFIAVTSFRQRLPGSYIIVVIAGISSIGLMVLVNFLIDSNLKWVLLAFLLPWVFALILNRLHK